MAFGARCVLEPGSSFKFDGTWRPGPAMRFGDDVFVGRDCEFNIRQGFEIGANVVVLKGVTIGRGAIIAAGSVLTRSVGEYEIWGGVPARKLRDRP